MKNQYLEAGQIVNTHGIQGEVKIVPWCDTPEFLCQFHTLYVDGRPVKVRASRVHKGNVLASLEGVDTVEITSTGYAANYRSHAALKAEEAELSDPTADVSR